MLRAKHQCGHVLVLQAYRESKQLGAELLSLLEMRCKDILGRIIDEHKGICRADMAVNSPAHCQERLAGGHLRDVRAIDP